MRIGWRKGGRTKTAKVSAVKFQDLETFQTSLYRRQRQKHWKRRKSNLRDKLRGRDRGLNRWGNGKSPGD